MSAVDDWKRGVLAVATLSSGGDWLYGTCFVIDAEKGLLWTAAHVLGEECINSVGELRHIGMPAVDGAAIKWIYTAEILCSTGAQSHKPANNFDNVDGALLILRERWVSGTLPTLGGTSTTLALTFPLLCADGTELIALPMKPDGLEKLQQVTLLGYPGATMRFTPTHSHLSGPKTDNAGDGEYWMTDGVMLPGHSGGPVMNVSGEVIGWNVRDIDIVEEVVGTLDAAAAAAGVELTNEVEMRTTAGNYEEVPATVRVRSGLNQLRPIRRVVDLLQQWVAAKALTEGFGPALPGPDILDKLAAKPGCVRSPMKDEEKQRTARLHLKQKTAEAAAKAAELAMHDAELMMAVATDAGATAARAGGCETLAPGDRSAEAGGRGRKSCPGCFRQLPPGGDSEL